jgi:class 3 adenylate cyclase
VLVAGFATNVEVQWERLSATPRTARHLLELIGRIDITEALAAVSVPTLVLHRRDDPTIPLAHGRQIAERVRGAELLELPGSDHYLFSGDPTEILAAIERFLAASVPPPSDDEDHVLATLLFVDVVDSTGRAQELGDRAWVELLDRFHSEVERRVDAHRGEVINTLGDGVLASFDGPGRAVRCALSLRDAVGPLGLDVRDVAGIGVHLAARVAGHARPGEVWVSRTVTDLVAGTGLAFEDRGNHELRGFAEPWRLFAAVD